MNIRLSKISSHLKLYYNQLLDYKTDRKIIVIESDDWGSIRVPSREVWDNLIASGYKMDERPYDRCDTLESNEDVESLLSVLRNYKDSKGHHPIITANYLSQNPDFDKIRANGFREYVGESIIDTYNAYPSSDKVIKLMKKGIVEGLVKPQCHGREHFNVNEWMTSLRHNDKDVNVAFNYKMCGIFPKDNPNRGNQYMYALRYDQNSKNSILSVVYNGLRMFKEIWGYSSQTFVAPCYTYSDDIEIQLMKNGVLLMQSQRSYNQADRGGRGYVYFGEKRNGLIHSIRNCSFEPSLNMNFQIDRLLREIETLFNRHKIVVISSHRINYVSGINKSNRDTNLDLLDRLLSEIIKRYPDVEFLSSDNLIDILA